MDYLWKNIAVIYEYIINVNESIWRSLASGKFTSENFKVLAWNLGTHCEKLVLQENLYCKFSERLKIYILFYLLGNIIEMFRK